jgi:hypothetical protein
MKSQFPLTNDHRLIGHISNIFKAGSGYSDITSLFEYLDMGRSNSPVSFRDTLIVYETFPVYGEFMFPKTKSHLWQLIESTDSPMLLTDAMVQGKEGLFICQPLQNENAASELHNLVTNQKYPSVCVNTYKGACAMLYPLISL